MKGNYEEMLVKFDNKIEMTDCKHFRYDVIKKGVEPDNLKIIQIVNCKIGMGGRNGCPKYCPLYETD